MTTIATATEIAARIKSHIGPTKIRPRVWSPDGADFARVYTGCRSEYLQVEADGIVTKSQTNLSWGHKIAEVLDEMGLEVA